MKSNPCSRAPQGLQVFLPTPWFRTDANGQWHKHSLALEVLGDTCAASSQQVKKGKPVAWLVRAGFLLCSL